MNTPLHDLHIHTNLSLCSSDPEQTVENISAWAAAHGVDTIGISNHVWDCDAPAGSEFYAGQPFSHIMKIRNQIPADLHGVRLLIGAETEFAGGKIMLSQACKDQLDYLLVPHSHIHMVGLVLPKDRVTDEQVADYLVTSFCDLVSKDFATIIAHPFGPVGRTPMQTKAILDCISDEQFADCFTLAAQHGAAIEINGSTFEREWNDPQLMANHERMFSIARDCGCTFTLGSDAHALRELCFVELAMQLAQRLSIPDDRFAHI